MSFMGCQGKVRLDTRIVGRASAKSAAFILALAGHTNPPPTPPYEDEGFLCNSPQREGTCDGHCRNGIVNSEWYELVFGVQKTTSTLLIF